MFSHKFHDTYLILQRFSLLKSAILKCPNWLTVHYFSINMKVKLIPYRKYREWFTY